MNIKVLNWLKTATRFVSLLTALVSLTSLSAYMRDKPLLATVSSNFVAMAPLTTISIFLLAGAIFASSFAYEKTAKTAAFAAGLFPVMVLMGRISYQKDVLDLALARYLTSSEILQNAAMSVATATVIFLIAAAMWHRNSKPYRADMFACIVMAVSAVALVGYLYGIKDLYSFSIFRTMALNTAASLFLLSLASVIVNPYEGWSEVVFSESESGRATRRQLLYLLFPPVVGWILLQLSRQGQIGVAAGMAFLVTLTVVPLCALILRDGKRLTILDQVRNAKSRAEADHASSLQIALDDQAQELAAKNREQEKAAAVIFKSRQIDMLGQLSGGIAHDFNNLLMSVSGNLQLLQRRLDADSANQKYIEKALQATQRGAKVTAQLMNFSRSQKLDLKPVSINQALSDAFGLIKHVVPSGIELSTALLDEDCWVVTDKDQLEVALVNLVVNARDAIETNGIVFVGVRKTDFSKHSLPKEHVSIFVEDNGQGMTEELLSRVTEPFFSTKTGATGLGLAQVHGFARQCGGDLVLTSTAGAGTMAEIFLPTVSAPATVAKQPESLLVRSGKGKILVIDDDDVRDVIVQALTDAGYQVTQASGGAEGLAQLDTLDPAVMVVDFMMPGMNGAETARQAQLRKPGLPVIFVSGYSDTVALEGIAKAMILRKPFDVEGLNEAVARVLH